MPLTRFLSASTAAMTAALTLAPAARATEFPKDFPYKISKPTTGEDTPLNLDPQPAAEHVSGGGGLVRTIVGLAIVIGVIYGLTWVLRQAKSGREQRSAGPGLETVATVALGPNRSLHLIRTGREFVLVGSAEQGVTPIRVYTDEEARELGLLDGDGGRGGTALADLEGGEAGSPPRLLDAAPADRAARPRPDVKALVEHVQRWTVRK
jgi:flagellar protein FliO/FliZ